MVEKLLFAILITFTVYSQNDQKSSIRTFDLLRTYKFEASSALIQNPQISFLDQYNQHLYKAYKTGLPARLEISNGIHSKNPFLNIIKGDYLISNKYQLKSDSLAYLHFENAFELGKKNNNKILQVEALKRLLLYNFKSQENLDAFKYWTDIYSKLAYDEFEKIYVAYFKIGLRMARAYYHGESTEGLEQYIQEHIEKANKKDYKYLEARLLQLYGNYLDLFSDSSKSLDLQEKALSIYKSKNIFAFSRHVNDMLYNIAYYHFLHKDIRALSQLRSIDLAKIKSNDFKDKILINNLFYEVFKQQKNIDSALFYLEKKQLLVDSLNAYNKSLAIEDINTKYQTAQKEKQILEEQAQTEKNRNIAIALGTSLVLLAIIASLLYRNTKRKQRIAEQEKELQIQKTATALKEQEINTINAMIEGQEKERLRIAGDLHDHLGGTLAAVKMHIGNLQNNLHKTENPKELLDKAEYLVSEAYKNVRSIAHERHSGVMAKEGLLPAVTKLASKVSSSGGLTISVQDFGLDERLSNHLEITIFRIIQELVTNVIKHAEASEMNISLTQHEEELNIVVEDNGKGFKVGRLEEKDGMGLGSIERRVEHLEGTMLVDSTLGRGTNIIIDIPV